MASSCPLVNNNEGSRARQRPTTTVRSNDTLSPDMASSCPLANNNEGSRARRRPTTTVHSNDTLGNTHFQLISDFFYVNQGVLPPGVCWKGGGGGGNR